MTGPEHYTEAQRRLLMAWEEDSTPERSTQLVAEAQVHATLALAAATALRDSNGRLPSKDSWAWQQAASAGPGA